MGEKFVTAIEYADKASSLGWLYGYNVIAFFISRHEKDVELLSAIAKRATLTTPFDYEQQLLASSQFENPWGLYTLAEITEDPIQSYQYLLESSSLGFPNATYKLALMKLENNNYEKYQDLLITAKQQNLALPIIDLELQKELEEHFCQFKN